MKEIKLSLGKTTIVDDDDYDKFAKLPIYAKKHPLYFYAAISIKGKPLLLHRAIMNAPKNMLVDHINHDTLDNRKENLRIVTKMQNNTHLNGAHKNSKTGIRGVSLKKGNRIRKWYAQISVNRKVISLGYFEDINDAAKAYLNANKQYFGEFGGVQINPLLKAVQNENN